jgi:hypothetical protein
MATAIVKNSDYDMVLTVTESGKKYVVKAQFPSGSVRCWGEMVSYKNGGRNRTFEKDITFTAATEFTVERELSDYNQAKMLFDQSVKTAQDRGETVRIRTSR